MALARQRLFASDELTVERVACDGHDPRRAREEVFAGDRVVIVLRGDFHLRHRRGRGFVDVRNALLARGGQPFVMAHPRGRGDVCLSFGGAAVTRLLDEHDVTGAGLHTAPPPLMTAARRLADDGGLGWQALLAQAFAPDSSPHPSPADREIAEAVRYTLSRRFDEPVRLADVARAAAVTPFHACRAFRRATGTTIHAWLDELRLQHALAALLDGEPSIAAVAVACGFANHGHLTNRFVARFGVTPSQARAGGVRRT